MRISALIVCLQTTLLQAICHPDWFVSINSLKDIRFLHQEKNQREFVLTLDRGVVVNEGSIVTSGGKILRDTETFGSDQSRLMRGVRDIRSENPLFFDGRRAVISSPGQENWPHWLLQVLPRLKILADSQVAFDKIYIAIFAFPGK